MKYDISVFFRNFKVYKNLTRITGTLHEDQYTFLITSRSGLLRIRNVSDKRCVENQNMHFIFRTFFLKNRALCGILWKRMAEPDRPQMTIRRMGIAFWISRTTDEYSEYFIHTPFPLQHWLHENALVLRYTYIVVLCMSTSF